MSPFLRSAMLHHPVGGMSFDYIQQNFTVQVSRNTRPLSSLKNYKPRADTAVHTVTW